MTTLILQSALLLAGAYFFGAWVACLIRRRFFALEIETEGTAKVAGLPSGAATALARNTATPPVRRPDPERVAPKIETIQRPAPSTVSDAAARYEKVLTTAPAAGPQGTAAASAVTTPAAPPVTRPSPAVPAAPSIAPPPPQAPQPAAVAPKTVPTATPAVAAAAAAAATRPAAPVPAASALPVAAGSSGNSTVSPPVAAAPPAVQASAVTASDDLTRIRAIDPALQARLSQLGISRYRDIAAWSPADVANLSTTLGFKGRIEQENWIEQAQILARGGETAFARRVDRGEVATTATAAPVAASGAQAALKPAAPAAAAAPRPVTAPDVSDRAAFAAPAAAAPAVPASPAARPSPAPAQSAGIAAAAASAAAAGMAAVSGVARDNLQRIGGVNAEVEKLLNVQGVGKYAQIGSWTPTDIMRFDRLLGNEGRIARENWVEQAQMLARGGETAFSRQFDQRGKAAVIAPTAPAPAVKPMATAPSTPAPAQAKPGVAATGPVVPAPAAAAPAVKLATAAAPIAPTAPAQAKPAVATTAPAAAAAVAADVARPSKLLDAIRDTASKTGADVPVTRAAGDISGLRSVRSEAFTGGQGAQRPGAPDDLKRIRGVGVLIEKKLNSMGVTTYAQVANWTAADIDRASQVLDFRGRIERENWVEQARILSAGGQTEFSRRVDRGEVETSKNKP